MNQSAGSIHFIAVRPHRSAPSLLVPTEQQGSSEMERKEKGLETSQQFKDSSFRIRFGSPEIWCFDGV